MIEHSDFPTAQCDVLPFCLAAEMPSCLSDVKVDN